MTIVGNAMWVASQCVALVGMGKLSGKYYLDKITNHVGGGGYTMDLEMSLWNEERRRTWETRSGWARFQPWTTPPAWCGWCTTKRTTT